MTTIIVVVLLLMFASAVFNLWADYVWPWGDD